MNKPFIMLEIFLVSFVLGLIKYKSISKHYDGEKWPVKFVEIFNDFSNYFLAGIIGYYFSIVRWQQLEGGDTLKAWDLALLIIFLFALFGHLSVISFKLSENIERVLTRIIGKQDLA